MGNCSSNKPDNFNIEEEYRKLNLPMPDPTAFENGFEKEAFFTANVFRHNPKLLIPVIKEVKSKFFHLHNYNNIDDKIHYKGKSWSQLVKEIDKIEEGALQMIGLDTYAIQACRENNEKIVADNKEDPEIGGNEEAYKKILGSQQKSGSVDEGTYIAWGGNGMDMVIMNLIQEYEAFTNPKKGDKKAATPALLDPLTIKMGVSFKAHKKTENIAQLLYVRQYGNAIE